MTSSNPIGLLDRLNAKVLLVVTPEYAKVKAARAVSGATLSARPGPFAIKPEFQTIAGKRLRFARGGRENAPVVLMLSPLPQSIIAFDQIWPVLADHFRVVALDLPGFGQSEGGYDVMNFEMQSRILEEFIDTLELEDLHIVGPDVGMPVALHYVIHWQHRAKSLIIGDGPCVLPTANGSIINKAVDSPFWRMVFRIAGAGAFVEGGNRLAYVNYRPSNAEVADYVASYSGRIGPLLNGSRSIRRILRQSTRISRRSISRSKSFGAISTSSCSSVPPTASMTASSGASYKSLKGVAISRTKTDMRSSPRWSLTG